MIFPSPMSEPNRVCLIDPEKDPRWDRFVEDHPFGWICHLSGWKRALESSFHHMKGYYVVLLSGSTERIEAGLPVFHVKSRILGDRLVSIPFGTLSDPLVENKMQFQVLWKAVKQLSASLGCRRIEIRAFNAIPFLVESEMMARDVFKMHFLKLDESPDRIWERFNRNVRRGVRRAQKMQVQLRENETPTAERVLDVFYQLHRHTRRRLGLPLQPYRFFKALWHEFAARDQLAITVAEHHGKTVGALLALKFRTRVSAEYIAGGPEAQELRVDFFLHWAAMQTAFKSGFKVYDFGRTDSRNEGLMHFKDQWGTEVADLPQYFFPEAPESVSASDKALSVRLLKVACRRVPDFAQDIIGGFCYRHIG